MSHGGVNNKSYDIIGVAAHWMLVEGLCLVGDALDGAGVGDSTPLFLFPILRQTTARGARGAH